MADATLFNVELLTAAGSTQTDAAGIPTRSSPALITAAGDDIVGIRLPPATAGKVFVIKNTGTGGLTGTLRVYPATGDSINALGANVPLDMASLSAAVFVAAGSTIWYTAPAVPS